MIGTVYLIHFDQPFKHARHYIGWTMDITKRVWAHENGRGSRLLKIVAAAGIAFQVVRTWEGDRKFERKIKRRKDSPKMCPVCRVTQGKQTAELPVS
jgi:predicted GIY-YIG superfamily endonuclease